MQVYPGTPPPVVKWSAATPERTQTAAPDMEAKARMAGSAREAAFVLSTDEVDRHGDVVSADGWRLEAYRHNPVLLWAHDYRRPAIGRAVAVWTEPHRLLATIEFAPSAFAQEVAALYEYGFQWGVSVGFRPIRWEERRDPRTGAFLGLRYLEQELLEVSAVPVPANRHALRRRANNGDSNGSGDSNGNGRNSTPPATPATSLVIPAASPVIPAKAGIQWQTIALGALLAELEAAKV